MKRSGTNGQLTEGETHSSNGHRGGNQAAVYVSAPWTGEASVAPPPSFVAAILRHKTAIAISTVLFGVMAFALTIPQTRTYRAHVSLEFAGVNDNVLNTRDIDPSATADNSSQAYINTQARVLGSEPLLRIVADKVRKQTFTQTGETDKARKTKALSRLSATTLAQAIEVRPVDGTKLVDIYVQSPDPDVATTLANTLAEEYMTRAVETRLNSSQRTAEWLKQQQDEAKARLERSEAALQAYARHSNLLFTGSEDDSVSEARLRQIQDEYSRAQADRAAKQSVYEQLLSETPENKTASLRDPALQEYQMKLSELNRQLADLNAVYAPGNQKVKRVESQIEELKKDYNRQHEGALARVKNDFDTSKRREALLATAFNSQQGVVTTDAAKSVDYNILKREAETNRAIYEGMLQKVNSYRVASAMQPSNAHVVDPAEKPLLPYKPNVPMTTMFGAFGGFVLAVLWAGIRDKGVINVQYPGQTKQVLQAPELGVIPAARLDPYLSNGASARLVGAEKGALYPRPAGFVSTRLHSAPGKEATLLRQSVETAMWFHKSSLLAESIRSIRTSLLYRQGSSTPQVLVVTSLAPAHGKTCVVSNLGIAMTEIGNRVLMVDADLRSPTLHKTFGLSRKTGLATVLKDDRQIDDFDFADFIQPTSIPNLSLLSSGEYADAAPAAMFHSGRMMGLITSLRDSYDTILIDTPPLILSDARVLGPLSDGVLLVLRAGEVKMESVLAAEERLAEDGTHVIGTVLNNWDPRSNGYGSYPDRYHKGSYFQAMPA